MPEPLRAVRGRTPPVDYWAKVTDWNGRIVYEGPAPVPVDVATVSVEDAAAGRLYTFDMTAVGEPPRGLIIGAEPGHWRWDKPHRSRRCLLCWVERLAVALRIARYEEDPLPEATVAVERPGG